MKLHYKVENLRSINKMDFVEIKPITVLLGKNNSGKSSLLRVFPLLRQSIREIDNLSLSWKGKYVDFGDFETSLSNNSDENEITFSFKIDKLSLHSSIQAIDGTNSSIKKTFNEIEYSVVYNNGEIKKLVLKLKDCNINVNIYFSDYGHNISFFYINDIDINKINDNELFKNMTLKLNEYNVFPIFSMYYKFTSFLYENTGPFTGEIYNVLYRFLVKEMKIDKTSISEFDKHAHKEINNIFKHEEMTKSTIKMLIKLSNSNIFKEFYKMLLSNNNEFIINIISLYCSTHWTIITVDNIGAILSKIAQDSIYIGPSRIDGERDYSDKNFDTSRMEHNGENLPMILVDFVNKGVFEQYSKWIEERLDINIQVKQDSKRVEILIGKDNTTVSIKDSGYGISQTLPILTQLWMISQNNTEPTNRQNPEHLFDSKEIPKIVTIEQPEAHLHPSFNDKFIDALVSTIKTCTTGSGPLFVVETHSKGIIDRLGELIVRNEIPREAVNIVLFENGTEQQDDNYSRIRRSFFNNKGMLENWPLGFMGY